MKTLDDDAMIHCLLLPSTALAIPLGDPLECSYFLLLTRIHHLVLSFDTLRSTLDSSVRTSSDDEFLFGFLDLGSRTLCENLGDRRCLLLLGKTILFVVVDTLSLCTSLLESSNSAHLLPSLGFRDLLDRSSVKSSHLVTNRLNRLLRRRNVVSEVTLLVVEEPRGEPVAENDICVSVESFVDELSLCSFTVDELLSESHSFGGSQTELCRVKRNESACVKTKGEGRALRETLTLYPFSLFNLFSFFVVDISFDLHLVIFLVLFPCSSEVVVTLF